MGRSSLSNRRLGGIFVARPSRTASSAAEDGGEFVGDFTGAGKIARLKGNSSHPRVSATAKFLRQRCQILIGSRLAPRICPEAYLGARGRRAHPDRIDAIGMQQVWNEFILALQVQIAAANKDHTVT